MSTDTYITATHDSTSRNFSASSSAIDVTHLLRISNGAFRFLSVYKPYFDSLPTLLFFWLWLIIDTQMHFLSSIFKAEGHCRIHNGFYPPLRREHAWINLLDVNKLFEHGGMRWDIDVGNHMDTFWPSHGHALFWFIKNLITLRATY